MFNDKGQLCNDKGDCFVIGKDGHIYLESFLKSQGKEKKQKDRYLDHVFLTKEEHDKLVCSYGEGPTKNLIQDLDIWLSNTKKIRTDHYKTILGFARKGGVKRVDPLKKVAQNYDIGLTEEQKQENKQAVLNLREKFLGRTTI